MSVRHNHTQNQKPSGKNMRDTSVVMGIIGEMEGGVLGD